MIEPGKVYSTPFEPSGLNEWHDWFSARGWAWSVGNCGYSDEIQARCWRPTSKPKTRRAWRNAESAREAREVHIMPGATPEKALDALRLFLESP